MRRSWIALCSFLLLVLISGCADPAANSPAASAPTSWIPTDPNLVVASFPVIGNTATASTKPTTINSAIARAKTEISLGQSTDHPRHFGRAEGLLKPWWTATAEPEVRVLMAVILQRNHNFTAALGELDLALAQRPHDAQAWLSKAMILKSQGRLQSARQACQPLRQLAAATIAQSCFTAIDATLKPNMQARKLLQYLLKKHPPADSLTAQWSHRVAAEAAVASYQPNLAEQHFKTALALANPSVALQSEWLDYLLEYQRNAEAQQFLQSIAAVETHDNLLLRRAIVAKRLRSTGWQADLQSLQQRQRLLQQRGDGSIHLREQARLALQVEDKPQQALELALRNWQVQREVWDARLVLESALLAHQPHAARPVIEWMASEDVRQPLLNELLAQLETPQRGAGQ